MDPKLLLNRVLRTIEETPLTLNTRIVPELHAVWVENPTFEAESRSGSDLSTDEYDDRQLKLDPCSYELVYIRIKYNSGHPFARESVLRPVFQMFRWWIEFPDGIRILRRSDVEGNPDLPDPKETSLYEGGGGSEADDMLINPCDAPDYDNIAFGYLETKGFVLRRGQMRGEVEYFGTGQNKRIHIPIWVKTKSQLNGDKIKVTINTPHFPHYQEDIGFEVAIKEDSKADD